MLVTLSSPTGSGWGEGHLAFSPYCTFEVVEMEPSSYFIRLKECEPRDAHLQEPTVKIPRR